MTRREHLRQLVGWAGLAPLLGRWAMATTADPWPASALLRPEQLAPLLKTPHPPLVLQVGFHVLYEGGHIPLSRYAGPASKPEGLELLKKTVAALPREREIVIYCGCCPMVHCPNIRPAYTALEQMGFSRVRVLDLPQNFGQDWVQRGLPVVRGA